jgi:tape measure domain-containing protein
MRGDVAGADQNRLKGLALVFGQIQSTGRLMGQDLLQLINQGFNPLTVLSKQTGLSMKDLKEAMEKGAISADMVTAAFRIATSEGGMFYGNLEAQSQTLQGRISTLKDNFVTALQNMAEAFLPLMKAAVDAMIAFDWSPVVGTVQAIASSITSLADGIGTLITWLKRLSPLLVFIFGPRLIAMITTAISSTRLYAGALTIVERAHLAAGAAANYQLTTMGLLKSAMFSASTAAKSFGTAMKGAMAAALSPLNVLLVGLTAIKELYDYFVGEGAKSDIKATFDEMEFEDFMAGGQWKKGGPEGAMGWQEGLYEMQKKSYEDILYGRKPATDEEKAKAAEDYKQSKKDYEKYLAMYRRARGIEWTTYKAKTAKPGDAAGAAGTPAMSGNAAEFQKMFADLRKAVEDNSKSTKKQTKATEDNTRAQKQFDITALSRQAFDATFNVKLKELTLGAIS